jgi:hypothetical protein
MSASESPPSLRLLDIWSIAAPADYKLHFARWNGHSQPLEVWARDIRRPTTSQRPSSSLDSRPGWRVSIAPPLHSASMVVPFASTSRTWRSS